MLANLREFYAEMPSPVSSSPPSHQTVNSTPARASASPTAPLRRRRKHRTRSRRRPDHPHHRRARPQTDGMDTVRYQARPRQLANPDRRAPKLDHLCPHVKSSPTRDSSRSRRTVSARSMRACRMPYRSRSLSPHRSAVQEARPTEETPPVAVDRSGGAHPTATRSPIDHLRPTPSSLPVAQAALAAQDQRAHPQTSTSSADRHVSSAGQLLAMLENRDLQGSRRSTAGQASSRPRRPPSLTATRATVTEDQKRRSSTSTRPKPTSRSRDRTSQTSAGSSPPRAPSPAATLDTAVAAAVQAQAAYDMALKHLALRPADHRHHRQHADRTGQLTSAQGKLLGAEAQVSYASLRSPINGVVTDRPLFAGETAAAGVAPSSPSWTPRRSRQAPPRPGRRRRSSKLGGDLPEITVPGAQGARRRHRLPHQPRPRSRLHHGRGLAQARQPERHAQGRHTRPRRHHRPHRPNALQVPTPPSFLPPKAKASTSVMVVGRMARHTGTRRHQSASAHQRIRPDPRAVSRLD